MAGPRKVAEPLPGAQQPELPAELPGEFARIARHFRPIARDPAARGLIDDVAVLDVPPGMQLVVKVDAIVAGVHFLGDEPGDLVARKLLRVNYSDLAAKGAAPRGCVVSLSLPREIGESWLAAFARGLAADLAELGGALLGGDMTATPGPITLSLTALGLAPAGQVPSRADARAGDDIYLSGTLGDAALGLRVLQGTLAVEDRAERDWLVGRYRLPQPRLALGAALRGIVHAAMDVSDGLVGDLAHVGRASGLGAVVEAPALPLSAAGARAIAEDPDLLALALTGGDDYEILFTAPPAAASAVAAAAQLAGVAVTRIGRMQEGAGVRVVDRDGAAIALEGAGYSHF